MRYSTLAYLGIYAMLASLLMGCSEKAQDGQIVVATYKGKELFQEEVHSFLPDFVFMGDSIGRVDSSELSEQYIEQWLSDQTVEEEAKRVIPDLEARIAYRLSNFRHQLIQYEYANWLIEKRLDSYISPGEIKNYYQQNPDKFIARASYFSYFHVRTQYANKYEQIRWMRSDKAQDLSRLRSWVAQSGNAISSKLDSTYLSYSEIQVAGEGYFGNITKLKRNVVFNYNTDVDGERYYNFFKMLEVIEPGDIKPLSLCEKEIKRLILNRRQQNLIRQRKTELLKKAGMP